MHVTITRQEATVQIVSIPRTRLSCLSHPILRCLLQPAPAFLSITCNELELSLFAEPRLLSDFAALARDDAACSSSSSSSSSAFEPVEISLERWSVLQIDSHSDLQLDNSGARVNELSAPLAAAGISILYQSSYMSDFLFVKESRLDEAMALFAAAGFTLYSSDPNCSVLASESPVPTPLAPSTVFTRERSATDPLPGIASALKPSGNGRPKPKKSRSPLARDIRALAPDLACVGLADDSADYWALKLVKLVAFPDLIPLTPTSAARKRRRLKEEEDDDGYFSRSHSPSTASVDAEEPESEPTACDIPKSPSRSVPSRLSKLPGDLSASPPASGISAPSPSTPASPAIPFFSFTRTPEGSSLTAGARTLAALFPRGDRHMVICGGELDAADAWAESEEFDAGDGDDADAAEIEIGDDPGAELPSDDDDAHDADALLTCLQIDLRRFGLEQHGLVQSFSCALAAAGVNHMYSSTFKSANLLVAKRQAARAGVVLAGC